MNSWFLILLIFIGLIIFLVFLGWIDWKNKCRKTIKENNLDCYLNGYVMLKEESKKPTLILYNGLLGVNSKELVFGHRFQGSVLYIKKELTDVNCFEIHEYNENDLITLLQEHYEFQKDKIKYAIINMTGISTTIRIPKLIKTRLSCKICFENDRDLYFYYKSSPKAVDALKKMQQYVSQNYRK